MGRVAHYSDAASKLQGVPGVCEITVGDELAGANDVGRTE